MFVYFQICFLFALFPAIFGRWNGMRTLQFKCNSNLVKSNMQFACWNLSAKSGFQYLSHYSMINQSSKSASESVIIINQYFENLRCVVCVYIKSIYNCLVFCCEDCCASTISLSESCSCMSNCLKICMLRNFVINSVKRLENGWYEVRFKIH